MELQVAVRKEWPGFTLDSAFVARGNRLGLFGASGSGKSTLAGMIAGLQQPDSGTISLDGEVLFDRERKINLAPNHRRIGVVFQQPHLFPHLTVLKNLRYGYNRSPAGERKIEAEELLTILQLTPLLSRQVQHLSGGEQQRVAIGRAVLANPRLLLLDESFSALDEQLKGRIIAYLGMVCAAFTIPYLFISHSPRELAQMTDLVLRCAAGKVSPAIPSAQLLREELAASNHPTPYQGDSSCLYPGESRSAIGGSISPTAANTCGRRSTGHATGPGSLFRRLSTI